MSSITGITGATLPISTTLSKASSAPSITWPQPNPQWSGEEPDSATSYAPYRLYNIGNNEPVELLRYIDVLEECLGRKAERNLLPLQPGDVPDTYADVDELIRDVGYRPQTPVEEGVAKFVDWYRDYYRA